MAFEDQFPGTTTVTGRFLDGRPRPVRALDVDAICILTSRINASELPVHGILRIVAVTSVDDLFEFVSCVEPTINTLYLVSLTLSKDSKQISLSKTEACRRSRLNEYSSGVPTLYDLLRYTSWSIRVATDMRCLHRNTRPYSPTSHRCLSVDLVCYKSLCSRCSFGPRWRRPDSPPTSASN